MKYEEVKGQTYESFMQWNSFQFFSVFVLKIRKFRDKKWKLKCYLAE